LKFEDFIDNSEGVPFIPKVHPSKRGNSRMGFSNLAFHEG
jgi:hypothetical protein